jgi:hypothetical protein
MDTSSVAELASADLEAALFAVDNSGEDPALRVGDQATWSSAAERMRGRLYTHMEFVQALAMYPGALAPQAELDASFRDLTTQWVDLRDAYYELAGLNPTTIEEHRPEAFKLARLAAQWVCRLWRLEKSGIGSRFSNAEIAAFMRGACERDVVPPAPGSGRGPGLRFSLMRAGTRIADAVERFDFFCNDRTRLVEGGLDVVCAQAQEAFEKLCADGDLGPQDTDVLEALIVNGTDLYSCVYLTEARRFTKAFLSLAPEEAAHQKHIAEIVGGVSVAPVIDGFRRVFNLMLEMSRTRAELLIHLGVEPK